MSDLPAPLVPEEVDLQDFPFMPLHVARLRDSDLAAEEDPEACWYAVLLWAASWHQIPAGSLPDKDNVLMKLVGLGRDTKTWSKHKSGALRGFVLCSDGRLYHPTVAEQAHEAWESKLRQRHRTLCAAIRQHNKRNAKQDIETISFDEWLEIGRPEKVSDFITAQSRVTGKNVTRDKESDHDEHERDNGSKGQGQGQGQGIIEEPSGSSPPLPPKHTRGTDWPEIPDWIPVEQWNGFIDMRRRKRANPTERAVKMLINKLDAFREQGFSPGEVLDQSTLKNWTDVFPLKDDQHDRSKQQPTRNGVRAPDGFERAVDRRLGIGEAPQDAREPERRADDDRDGNRSLPFAHASGER